MSSKDGSPKADAKRTNNSGPHSIKNQGDAIRACIGKPRDGRPSTNPTKTWSEKRPRLSPEEGLKLAELEVERLRKVTQAEQIKREKQAYLLSLAAKHGKRPLPQHVVKQMVSAPSVPTHTESVGEGKDKEKEEKPYVTEDDLPPQTDPTNPTEESEEVGRANPIAKSKDGNKKRDLLVHEQRRQDAEDAGERDAQRELRQQRIDEEPPLVELPDDKGESSEVEEEARRLHDLSTFEFRFADKASAIQNLRRSMGWLFIYILTAITGFGSSAGASILALIVTVANIGLEHFFGIKEQIALDLMDIWWGVIRDAMPTLYSLAILIALWITVVAMVARRRTGKWCLLTSYSEYKVLRLHYHPGRQDLRADSYARKDATHMEPYYADVKYTKADVGLFWMHVESETHMVSLELFSQLSVPNILVPNRDPKFVALALTQAAGRIDTVNISRYDVFRERADRTKGEDTFGNTVRMVWAFYLCISERAEAQPFRLSP